MTDPFREVLRTRLWLVSLEERATPTATVFDTDADRVLVSFTDPGLDASHFAVLSLSPLAIGVNRIAAGLYRVDLAVGTEVRTAVTGLGQLPGVAAAQPDYRVEPGRVPNDPGLSSQWGLSKIGAPSAWDQSTGTGAITVAVIDTGVDYAHPDLAANMWRNPREVPGNGRDDDGNGFADDVYGADFRNNDGDPNDESGHGTHVAGIIGARGDNGIGGSGVAWEVRIMALKFMGKNGYTSDAIRAIDYAVANGARIINASWGSTSNDPALAAAIGRARSAGILVVAAAGNGSDNLDSSPFYPARFSLNLDNMVTVAATDRSDDLAGFSNYGSAAVSIAAPGVGIYSTLPNGRYGSMSGTSMAAPFVSGAAAILWSAHPNWSYHTVIDRLEELATAQPGLTNKVTEGRLDLSRMFNTSPPAPPSTGTVGPRVVNSAVRGPRAGVYDRMWVQFSEPINPDTFTRADASAAGPLGSLGISAVLPVAGKNNTEFVLMFSRSQTAAGAYSLAIGPDVRDLAGNAMDQNGNGVGGEAADRFSGTAQTAAVPPTVPPATGAARKSYSLSGMPRAIQDRRTTRLDIAVTEDFRIADLNVQLVIAHARTHDLNIRIVAPDGRSVTLFNRRSDGANLTGTVFDDGAAAGIGSAAAPFAGVFRPENPLSLFNGMNARGIWSVQVFDLADGVTGSVSSVLLSFVPQNAIQQASAPVAYQSLTAADLRGTDDTTQTAVLNGRDDAPTRSAGLSTVAPVRIGWSWFGENTASPAPTCELSILLSRREGLPLSSIVSAPPADPWSELADNFGPIQV